jgi:hypothetical protein
MNTLEKLNALQAGEFDKVLEGTPYKYPDQNAVIYNKTNAAKVEVTKGVLDEVLAGMAYIPITNERAVVVGAKDGQQLCMNGAKLMQALTLLKTLREEINK